MASYKVPPPVFSDDITYSDWKTNVELWSRSILETQLNKKQKAIILYQSLKNEVQKTVLSEIGIDDIDHTDGIKNILTAMDSFYEKDKVKSGCTALDQLMKYRRPKDLPIDKFIIDINLKMNRVETLGVAIPDAFKAYILLECANLSQNKKEICRATCKDLTSKDMRAQIEKVGLDFDANASTSTEQNTCKSEFAVIKTEPITETLFVQSCLHCGTDTTLSSDEEYPNETYYTNKSRNQRYVSKQKSHAHPYNNYNKQNQFSHSSRGQPTPNPLNKFGHYTTCDFCKSIYHYLPDCPDCPHDIKSQYSSRKQFKYGRNNNQPTY